MGSRCVKFGFIALTLERAQCHIQRLSLENRCISAASIASQVEGVGWSACQCSDHTLHNASLHALVCMAVVPEGSLF